MTAISEQAVNEENDPSQLALLTAYVGTATDSCSGSVRVMNWCRFGAPSFRRLRGQPMPLSQCS